MANEKENIYLCAIEIQEAREGIFLLPKRKIEFKLRKKNDEDALDFAKGMLNEEVNRAKEKGVIIHQGFILYKQLVNIEENR